MHTVFRLTIHKEKKRSLTWKEKLLQIFAAQIKKEKNEWNKSLSTENLLQRWRHNIEFISFVKICQYWDKELSYLGTFIKML